MQAKAVRMVRDEDRICVACGSEASLNAGPSDDLRYFDSGLYHPTCHQEVDDLVEVFTKNQTSAEQVYEILSALRINPNLIKVTKAE